MNSIQKISTFFDGLEILSNMDVMKLAENGQLVKEMKDVMSSKNLWSIVSDIDRERHYEKQEALNSKSKSKSKVDLSSNINPNSKEFLSLYSRYQSAAHNVLRDNIPDKLIKYTSPVSMKGAQAFNSKNRNPMTRREIKNLPETRQFAEAFNSVFSNHALQIGTSQDPTLIQSYIDYSPYIWNYQWYLSIPTLSQTIDRQIDIATRVMPKIECKNKQFSDEITTYLKRTMFNEHKVHKMLLYSDLSPRGSLIVPIEEDGRIRFNVFNDTQFTYATSYQYSKIDFQDNATGVSQLYVLGHMLQNEVTAHFLCPGFEPIFAIGKNRLFQLKDAAEAINIYLYTIKVLCIRAQIMIQTSDMAGQNDTLVDKIKKQTANINSKLSLNTAVNLPTGSELNILNNNFNQGFAEISPIIKQYQGLLSDLMPDYLYGSDTAYSANHFNIHATHQNIHSQVQIQKIKPIYHYAINTLITKDERFKKYENELDQYDLVFPSLYEPTEQERADTAAKKIDNLTKMLDYSELEETFKKEGLLPDDVKLSELATSRDTRPPIDQET